MKLTSVNYTTNANNNYRKNNQAFKGGVVDGLVKFWQFVDNGGRAIQFTVEDGLGTNFPRTYKGAMAGYKYTHKINIPALLQEGIREFLTGPTMCIVPWAIISASMKHFNKTSDTHIENIRNLSSIMETVPSGEAKDVQRSFFENAATDMLQKTSGQSVQTLSETTKTLEENALTKDDVKTLTDKFVDYANALKNEAGLKGKDLKKATSEAQQSLGQTFETIIKRTKREYEGSSFLGVSYSKDIKNNSQTGSTGFKNYANYIVNYMQDFAKSNTQDGKINVSKETVDKFKNFNVAKRSLIVASMFFVTGFAMSFIPKIYTFFSGSINPNATAIYDEANGKNKTEGGAK